MSLTRGFIGRYRRFESKGTGTTRMGVAARDQSQSHRIAQVPLSKMGQTVHSSAGENCAAIWGLNFSSGELPSCGVQSAAVNEFIHRGVKDSWKREYWQPFSSGRFVANVATAGFSAGRSPATAPPTGRQRPTKTVCQAGYQLLGRRKLSSSFWPSHSFAPNGAVSRADDRAFGRHESNIRLECVPMCTDRGHRPRLLWCPW